METLYRCDDKFSENQVIKHETPDFLSHMQLQVRGKPLGILIIQILQGVSQNFGHFDFVNFSAYEAATVKVLYIF